MLLARWLLHVILAMLGPAADEAPVARESSTLREPLVFPVEREPAGLATLREGASIPREREVDLAPPAEADEIPDVREAMLDAPATREK